MKRAFVLTVPMLVTSVLLAACGSSSKTSSASNNNRSAGAGPASATTTSSSGSRGYGYGGSAYGGSGSSSSGSSGSSSATMVSTKHSKLGMILDAGSKQLTVYLFEKDRGPHSSCSGACSGFWPPVTTRGKPDAVGGALAADLGTITRPDGTKQVTYKGHPLYYFAKDKDSGDAYGEGMKAFGAEWYVLAPSGSKVDNS